jgi:DNA-binding LacI/PurR family transcriptional regulator
MPVRAPARPTLADVAAAAGVGTGTVSRVLNGGVHVRESTRRHVEEVIERLGYRPSHLAAALSRGTPRTVAILVPYLTRPSTVARLAGALAVLDEQGYYTIVCAVGAPEQRDHHLGALTARHRADGVIVVSIPLGRHHVSAFRRGSIPVVTVDVAARGVPQTIIDNVAGGGLATAHLLDLGHRRIGFVGDLAPPKAGRLGFVSSSHRLRGYQRELARSGIGFDPALVRLGPPGPAVAAELAGQLLGLPEPPTAIFAASDTQAMGVLRAAEQRGFPVPGRLSVVGFDDVESSALLDLSTVHQPLENSGAEGARRLCALLHGGTVRPLRQQLPLRMVKRGSSAPPPGRAGGRSHRIAAAARRAPVRAKAKPHVWQRAAEARFAVPTACQEEGVMQ